ncbi:zinc finger B-box domain-containing protein 1 [Ctenodactylus gundi]
MNIKDFVVLPRGKSGNSVKLKYRNVQELRMEKVQLQLENQEMEEKLQEFRSVWSKEKEEAKSSGYHWKSGKVDKLGNQSHMISQNKGHAIKLSAGKVKLKLLKQQLQEPVKQTVNYKMSNCSGIERPKIKGKACGQCENKAALLVCLECGENYCSGCFAKIHQKGALKLHRTTLLQTKSQILSSVLDAAHRFIKEVNIDEAKGENNSIKEGIKIQDKPKPVLQQGSSCQVEITPTTGAECTKPKYKLLSEGSFDEEASAQSFQEAVSQWRTGSNEDAEKQTLPTRTPDSSQECEIQTNLKICREPLNIEFQEDSLSYMEKLWLKKHRRTPQEQLINALPETLIHPSETTSEAQSCKDKNEDSDVEDIKFQYPALFLPVEDVNKERPEPSVKIIELDDTYEEEFEEPANVPYKVELADAGSQSSSRRIIAETSKADLDVEDPDVFYPDTENIGKNSLFEGNLKERSTGIGSSLKPDDPRIFPENLLNVDLDKASVEEILSQESKEFLEFSKLHEMPAFEDSKATKSPLLIQEIALRSKPITKQYQGLERFFTSDNNERVNLCPSHSLEHSCPGTKITLPGNREWIPHNSVIAQADNVVAPEALQSVQHPLPSIKQRTMANVMAFGVRKVYKMVHCKDTQMFGCGAVELHSLGRTRLPGPMSKEQFPIRASGQCETALWRVCGTAERRPRQTCTQLRKMSGVPASRQYVNRRRGEGTDSSRKLYSLTTEELPAFNNHSLNITQIPADLLNTSHVKGPWEVEDLSSSGKDTKMQSLLPHSESREDEEKNFLDKQHVIPSP